MWSVKARLTLAGCLLAALLALATGLWAPLLVGVALALQLVYAHLVFRPEGGLQATRQLDIDRIRERDTVEIETTLTNAGRSTAFLEARDVLPRQVEVTQGRPSVVAALEPGGTRELATWARCPLMGVYDMGPLEARLEDPYALFFEERLVLQPNQLIVMPAEGAVEEVEPIVTLFQSFQGEYQINQPGDGFDFFGMRDYVPGDVYRSINWQASAKADRLIVNQFERTTSSQITVLIDGRAIAAVGPEDRTPFVQLSRAIATLLRDFFGRRDTPQVVVYGNGLHTVHPGPAERMITESLETLAMWQPEGDEPLSSAVGQLLPRLVEGSPVVLFSALLDDPTIMESVARLLANDLVVLVVSPPDVELPGVSEEERRALLASRARVLDELRAFDVQVIEPPHLATPTEVVA